MAVFCFDQNLSIGLRLKSKDCGQHAAIEILFATAAWSDQQDPCNNIFLARGHMFISRIYNSDLWRRKSNQGTSTSFPLAFKCGELYSPVAVMARHDSGLEWL
jgi:hypothetical protein